MQATMGNLELHAYTQGGCAYVVTWHQERKSIRKCTSLSAGLGSVSQESGSGYVITRVLIGYKIDTNNKLKASAQ